MAAKVKSNSEVLAALAEFFHPKVEEEDPEHPKTPPCVYHDADFLRGLLEDARILITRVLQESLDLTESTNKFKDEAFEIQEIQTKDIQEKRKRIEELEALSLKKNEDMVKQKEADDAELFEACHKLKVINRRLQDTMGKQVEELKTLLDGVLDFRTRQVEVEGRMAAAEEYAAKTKASMERMLPDLERTYLEKCDQHEKEFERKFVELKKQVTAEVEDRVGERMRNILADNEQLIRDVRIHVGATSGLTELKDELEVRSSHLAVEVGLLKASEALHVKRGSIQHHLVESHASKVAMLEKSLRQVIRQYGNERAQLENSHRVLLLGLEAEKQVLRNLVLAKTKELKRLRHLAQHVVNQRCEVENFLIESLEYIREQLAASRKNGGRSRHTDDRRMRDDCSSDSSSYLPSIKSTPRSWPGAQTSMKSYQIPTRSSRCLSTNLKSMFHQHHDFIDQLHEVDGLSQLDLPEDVKDEVPRISPKVDISDLSWVDREKVLRYLFQKINQVHQPGITNVVEDGKSELRAKSCRNNARAYSNLPYTVSESGRLLC